MIPEVKLTPTRKLAREIALTAKTALRGNKRCHKIRVATKHTVPVLLPELGRIKQVAIIRKNRNTFLAMLLNCRDPKAAHNTGRIIML